MAITILLADDSVTIQKVVELTFMDQDYHVIAVSDGTAALAKLSELEPDLLIADVHMPGANGYEVCKSSKKMYPDMPVLLLVGTFEPFDEQQAAAAGADSHLKKPFDSQDLLQQVSSLVAGRGGAEAAAPEPAASSISEPAEAVEAAAEGTGIVDLEPPLLTEEQVTAVAEAASEVDSPPRAFASPFSEEPAEVSEATAEIELGVPEESPPAASAPAAPAPAAPAPAASAPAAANGEGALSEGDVDRVARRVAELLGEKALREVAWEVVPDLAELIIKERIRELESQVE